MADQSLPFRRYLSANSRGVGAVGVSPSERFHWTGSLAGRPALIAFAGIAVVTVILVQRYLGSLGRFARFVGELSGEREPVMPRSVVRASHRGTRVGGGDVVDRLAPPACLDRQSRGLRAGDRRRPARSADRG